MKLRTLLIAHALLFFILSIIAIFTEGTGGGGDSLTHYFISKSAWSSPSYFLDLWGKPFFTLLSSPFAQFGFVGIKLFNTMVGVLSSLVTCLVAKELNKPYYWLILPIAFVSPAFYAYTFSGLTEPLAALLAITAVWLCLKNKIAWGFILASFLPFARTEAQIFLLFFFIFGVINGHFKQLPLLATSYILISIIGLSIHDNIFWVFTSPYDSAGSVYGHGHWYHYLERLKTMIAWPGIVLAGLGVLYFIKKWLMDRTQEWKQEPWLIHGLFFSLLVGHSIVWTLGIYGSAGLERTLITVFPFLWLMILDGILFSKVLVESFYKSAGKWLIAGILICQAIFTWQSPFTKYYWYSMVQADKEYRYFKSEVASFIEEEFPNVTQFVMDKPDMALALNSNFMNPENRLNWSLYHNADQVDSEILWLYDSHYVPVQYGITLSQIESDGLLKELKRFDSPDGWTYIVYQRL